MQVCKFDVEDGIAWYIFWSTIILGFFLLQYAAWKLNVASDPTGIYLFKVHSDNSRACFKSYQISNKVIRVICSTDWDGWI